MSRKLRSSAAMVAAMAASLAVVAWLLLPAVAGAKVLVTGYEISPSLDAAPSGGNTTIEPAIAPAPDGSDAEWFVVSGQNQDLLSITPTGEQSRVVRGLASDAGSPDNYASVVADGYDWILDNDQGPGNVLYAVGAADSPNPGLNPVARFGDFGQDMTLGADGALYVSDNAGIIRCEITPAPSATCTTAAIPPPFYTGAGAFAIGAGGDSIWFTDGGDQLGGYSAGGFTGPFPGGSRVGSTDAGTIAAAPNGYVYMAGGAGQNGGSNNEVLVFSPSAPNDVRIAASGLGNVVSLTIGPDGNVWLLDASGNGSVDSLNTSTNKLRRYALPAGLWLPQSGWRIATGPSVTSTSAAGEVFFTGTTSADGQGSAEIGEVSGIPVPVMPGILAFKPEVKVSKHRVAILTLICTGQSNSQCAGKMGLNVRAKVKVRVEVRAAKNGAHAHFRTVTRTKALTLGVVSYSVRAGLALHSTLTLSAADYNLLETVAGHTWKVDVRSTTTIGTVTGRHLMMTGPTPPRARQKQKQNK